MKPYIKYIRSDNNKLILIPTKEGWEQFKDKTFLSIISEKQPANLIRFTEVDNETIGANKVSALVAELDNTVQHLTIKQAMLSNEVQIRAHTISGSTYFSKFPYGIVEQDDKKAEAPKGLNPVISDPNLKLDKK